MAVFEHKSTNTFSPNDYRDAGIVLPRLTGPNATQNKHRGGWGISTEVDLRGLYLTSPGMVYMAEYMFFFTGVRNYLPQHPQ